MVGKQIKKARLLAGLTQKQFGELIGGKGVSTVSEWESGKRSPDIELIPLMSKILNVSISFLIEEPEEAAHTVLHSPKEDYDYLSSEEHTLVDAYRAADDRAREDAIKTLLSHPREKSGESAI